MKKEFLLDTHTVIWFLQKSSELNSNVLNDIIYRQHRYVVSDISLLEIAQLISLGKCSISDSIFNLSSKLVKNGIDLFQPVAESFDTMLNLPIYIFGGKRHTDPFDRYLIAEAINYKLTLISHDSKFPSYRSYGLDLLEI